MPRVSLGLPVYNGEKYLAGVIDSVLAQTFADFELIISDNASTDRTEAICREYAERDRRVRYFRNERNLGIARNFNRTFELSTGEYFKWIPADGAIEPEFLTRCVEVLDQNPAVILACTQYIVDSEITKTTQIVDIDYNLRFERPYQRFYHLISTKLLYHFLLAIWGLMRSSALRQTHLLRPFIGADSCLIIELGLEGQWAQVPEPLVRTWRHRASYTNLKDRNYGVESAREAKWFDPENKGRIFFPHWRRLREYFFLILHSKDTLARKTVMVGCLLFPLAARWRRILIKEVFFAFRLGHAYLWMERAKERLLHVESN